MASYHAVKNSEKGERNLSNKCILGDDNYHEWAIRTKLILRKKQLWEAIEGFRDPVMLTATGEPVLDENGERKFIAPSYKEQKRREKLKDTALSDIAELVDKERLQEIEDLDCPKEAWERLKVSCTNYDFLYEISFLKDLLNCKKDDSMTAGEYI